MLLSRVVVEGARAQHAPWWSNACALELLLWGLAGKSQIFMFLYSSRSLPSPHPSRFRATDRQSASPALDPTGGAPRQGGRGRQQPDRRGREPVLGVGRPRRDRGREGRAGVLEHGVSGRAAPTRCILGARGRWPIISAKSWPSSANFARIRQDVAEFGPMANSKPMSTKLEQGRPNMAGLRPTRLQCRPT